ncbi:RNA polymerase sigma-70 factor [Chitinophaga silvatica]|uniref:RNA polymerase sigma-70 factor n=1 Tax=Chitinophaga silvatica TaxID=2282649 RepID=A0A3E1YES0_9BACT|nr:RNA polymerase sigma-70 factor [Chitinophaga silvatica]RFS25050.1 RNA polymerase sigma-70 factor [Chitinophaga silvatica]
MTQVIFSFSTTEVNEALLHRNVPVFRQLYLAYSQPLYLLAFRLTKDESLAKDLVHNLFVNLWEKSSQLTITGNVQHYLFRAITNLALNEIKKRKKHTSEEILQWIPDEQALDSTADFLLFQQELLQHLKTLPPRCQEIFILSRVHGLEPPEIAQKLSITLNTVYYQLSIALKSLRQVLLEKKS